MSSNKRRPRPRAGFTLIEALMAVAVMGLVIGAVFGVVISARKAQAISVAQGLLKLEGQRAMNRIYKELMQSRRILASLDSDTGDRGLSHFQQIESFGLCPPLSNQALWVFPRMEQAGATGSVAPANVGNMFMFVERVVELPITGYTIAFGSTGGTRTLTADKPYRVYVYRFVAYYLGNRPLPAKMPPVNGETSCYGLVRWESAPYLELSEISGFLRRLATPAEKIAAWNALRAVNRKDAFFDNETLRGAIDVSQPNGALAISQIDNTGNLVPSGERIKLHKSEFLTRFQTVTEALGMVSYNTGPNFQVSGNFLVPSFARALAPTTVPYGFEVVVTGSNSARAVLMRLALAARLNVGLHTFGVSHQQITQVFDN